MKKHFLGKIFCLLMVVALVVGIVGCKNGNGNDSNGGDTATYYTVTFDVQGHGAAPNAQTVAKDGHATEPNAPSETGWTFEGWYKESGCANKYNFTTETVTKNITLYAKWTEYTGITLPTDKTPTIYLAGDSTVQAYSETQYIAGWGQYLDLFLDENIKVVNAARGGRSSRSFINEDRLFANTDGTKYSFSENGGKSIEETIQKGDFLFIQFGHNDDASKGASGATYMYDRMVLLGTPDVNGVYPVTAPEVKRPTTYLPQEYLATNPSDSAKNTALAELAKYGSEYYAYGDGTYKWYLKQFVDLAREKGAIPVLMTPVARVSFNSDGTLKSGAGLHGEDFAYVKAVRQLAEEENCLLIDNFAYTKETLEKATREFADFLMAIVPNQINNGPWPTGYDNAYKNSSAGYDKMEGTHYNKYGAYITAAYVAEAIIESNQTGTVKGDGTQEYFTFGSKVLTTPKGYIQPSNRIGINKVAELEGMFDKVNPTDPERTYKQPSEAIAAIEALAARGDISTITAENYETWKGYCEEARAVYESLNFDLRKDVTNYSVLESYEAAVKAARPKPVSTIVLCANEFTNVSTPVTNQGHTFTFDSALIEYNKKGAAFTYNDVQYAATTKAIRLNGNASLTSNQTKFIEFTVTGACTVTMVASGGGSTTDVVFRYIQMVDANKKAVCEYAIGPEQAVVSNEIAEGGTYRIGSKSSNIDLYYIIIEYYA
ncbi:MAG: InlB B-repeat-containing protein [Clostridia bacterium]|nr:InlB B-repeat-containing protein [Clostridia bacterium]